MTRRIQVFQRRFGSSRPGLQLVGVEDAAIPVTTLRADVLAQERKELPITEEFALMFAERGLETPEDIAAYLGLEPVHVLDAAAAQVSENSLRRRSDGNRLTLTPQGAEVVRNAATVQPAYRNLPVKFDRLTWQPADYLESSLIPKKTVDELGYIRLPAERKAHVSLDSVTPAMLNALLRRGNLKALQVLQIHKLSTKKNLYLPVELLVYADQSRGEIELAVCIDDEISDRHGLALDRAEVVRSLRMSIGAPVDRPMLEAELESQRHATGPLPVAGDPVDPMTTTQDGGVTAQVRSVSVFEHPDLLAAAISSATTRILIISPWVRRAVVTTDFLSKIEARLRRGVLVTIAHGYSDDDSGSDDDALRRLENLASRYPGFNFVRVRNTHAKILIFDDNWVSTSFNWLSFRGDPSRTYRMEEGTLVTIPNRVQQEYERYVQLIEDDRRL